jgi:hypothetical protein
MLPLISANYFDCKLTIEKKGRDLLDLKTRSSVLEVPQYTDRQKVWHLKRKVSLHIPAIYLLFCAHRLDGLGVDKRNWAFIVLTESREPYECWMNQLGKRCSNSRSGS